MMNEETHDEQTTASGSNPQSTPVSSSPAQGLPASGTVGSSEIGNRSVQPTSRTETNAATRQSEHQHPSPFTAVGPDEEGVNALSQDNLPVAAAIGMEDAPDDFSTFPVQEESKEYSSPATTGNAGAGSTGNQEAKRAPAATANSYRDIIAQRLAAKGKPQEQKTSEQPEREARPMAHASSWENKPAKVEASKVETLDAPSSVSAAPSAGISAMGEIQEATLESPTLESPTLEAATRSMESEPPAEAQGESSAVGGGSVSARERARMRQRERAELRRSGRKSRPSGITAADAMEVPEDSEAEIIMEVPEMPAPPVAPERIEQPIQLQRRQREDDKPRQRDEERRSGNRSERERPQREGKPEAKVESREGQTSDRQARSEQVRGERSESTRSEVSRADSPRTDSLRGDSPRGDSPRGDSPRGDSPRTESSRSEQSRSEQPRSEQPRGEQVRGEHTSRRERPEGRSQREGSSREFLREPRESRESTREPREAREGAREGVAARREERNKRDVAQRAEASQHDSQEEEEQATAVLSSLKGGAPEQSQGNIQRAKALASKLGISVVIPLYNEQESLRELTAALKAQLIKLCGSRYEIIYVNDGSTDRSGQILSDIIRGASRVTALTFRRNMGKSAGLAAGFKEAKYGIVITMDADLQDDPREIPNLVAKLEEGYDLVSGWKKKRYDPVTKTAPSKFFNNVTSFFAGIKLHDFNCGLKAYRKEVTDSLDVYGEMHRYLPALAHWRGFKVGEIPVVHHPRKFGKSKFGSSRFFKGFLDLLSIVFTNRFGKRPLHLFGTIGTVLAIAGFFIDLWVSIEWAFMSIPLSNRPILLLGVLLILVGVQLISLGLLGEMIVKNSVRTIDVSIVKERSTKTIDDRDRDRRRARLMRTQRPGMERGERRPKA